MKRITLLWAVAWLPVLSAAGMTNPVVVRVSGLPSQRANSPQAIASYRVLERFQELHPGIKLESSTPLEIQGIGSEASALLAIAGGTSPDILTINFRQSDTYIRQGFLHPLDEYINQMPAAERDERIPSAVLPVVYRENGGAPQYWLMPYQVGVKVLMYRRDLFAAAGLDPDRPPRDWEELREWARQTTDPARGIYGLGFHSGMQASWSMYTYLVSAGAQAVRQLPDGEWRACFDTEEAVTAFEFVDDLLKEPVTKNGLTGPLAYRGADFNEKWADGKIAMMFVSLISNQLGDFNPQLIGVAAIPTGPTGRSSSELNCSMYGIFAGQKDKRVRDAAWEYIRFVDSPEARRILTQTMVEQGAARTLPPKLLRQYGFPELANLALPGVEAAYEAALTQGTPEPYGKNCQFVYGYMTKPMEQAYYSNFTGLTRDQKRAKLKEFLTAAVHEANERMLGIVPAPVRVRRNAVAWVVAVVVLASFVGLLWQVFRRLNQGVPRRGADAPRHQDRTAILLLAPALGLILLWQYYPLLRGSLMAFQNYNLLGHSTWVGINNFADVLYDAKFWRALKNAVYFCALWMTLGFLPPVCLAIILQEIPLGKIVFRILFYLPHLVSGVVIFFMWRALYDPSPNGILNQVLGFFQIPPQRWLDDPKLAMVCVVFPLAWAGLGSGCLIYLAALKGIPDELYEAAEIDGASFLDKLRFIVFAYLKPLLVINAVGATIFGFKSTDAVLAMTGGGPNGATQVIGYEIWQRSFLFLLFGQATAMAWILGVLLLSFAAYQLKILNKVEFRTTGR